MKTITYSASSELGARSLALQDGHTGEPKRIEISREGYSLTYTKRSRLAVLFRQRYAMARRAVESIAHRARCDQQAAIVRGMRQ